MRVKGGVVTRRRHNRITKLASGFRGRRKNCFKLAKDAVQRSLANQYEGRKQRKRQMRRLWNIRINAAARTCGISYSRLIHGLKLAQIDVDRKILAELAVSDPQAFGQFAERAKAAL